MLEVEYLQIKRKSKGKMVAYDTGAARFNNNQKNIRRLIKHYGLEKM